MRFGGPARILFPALAAAALALSPASGAGARAVAARCARPPHAKALASDPDLRAWVRYGAGSGRPGSASAVVAVCGPPHGRTRDVFSSGASSDFSTLEKVQTAGPVLGFDAESEDQYSESQELIVCDARGRRLLRTNVESWPIAQQAPSPGFDGYTIDGAGDVAWVETNAGASAGGAQTLFLRTAAGRTTLASASSITDVALGGGEVTWDADGSAASAPLDG
ncbi:MAG TPA: hypothetical protein VL977_04085 [Solirubrobacteraceae bacterium]|nr:hypothetical protein [Solirubrobacteraceae bacterium]